MKMEYNFSQCIVINATNCVSCTLHFPCLVLGAFLCTHLKVLLDYFRWEVNFDILTTCNRPNVPKCVSRICICIRIEQMLPRGDDRVGICRWMEMVTAAEMRRENVWNSSLVFDLRNPFPAYSIRIRIWHSLSTGNRNRNRTPEKPAPPVANQLGELH